MIFEPGGFSERLRLWVTLNVVCCHITPPHICILPKRWFPIMGVAPPYLMFPLIIALENPDNPSGASQSN